MTDRSSSTTGKVALVTGATSGIGRAAAISLAHRGYRIIAVGRDTNRGVGVVDELERVGAGGEFLPCDLLDLADVRRLAHVLTERYRHLDVLLNNAGGIFRAKALTQDGIERTFALNVVAPLRPRCRAPLPSEQAKGELQTSSPRYRHAPVLTSTD